MSGKYGKSGSYRAAQKDKYSHNVSSTYITLTLKPIYPKICNCIMTLVAMYVYGKKMKDFRHISGVHDHPNLTNSKNENLLTVFCV